MGKKFLLFSLTSVTVLILGVISFTFQFVTSIGASMDEEVNRKELFEKHVETIDLKDGDPISILLMGVDTRPGEEGGRADTMVLLTINPDSQSMHMVSIPRDTYANIEGALNKINSAYQVGGPEETIHSVENLLDVPVDYFLQINMEGFEGIIDAFDGVEVNNDLEFTDKQVHFPEGQIRLDGKEALIYARMRKKDPRGDFGRQIRQRQVIEALMQKGENISSITKFGEVVKVLEKNIKTNMSPIEMWNIQSNYKDSRKNIMEHKIEGKDKTMKGTYYYMPDKEKLHDISDQLKNHLELEGDSKLPEKDSKANGSSNKPNHVKEEKETTPEPNAAGSGGSKEDTPSDDAMKEKEESDKQKEKKDSDGLTVKNSDEPNVDKVITKDWQTVPTNQENHTRVTLDEGSLDWEEMTAAISRGADLSKEDMILWWVESDRADSAIATVTNKAQTETYRVYVSWLDGAGYTPTKVEVLHVNDQKQ
jgi:LCP family protein required for cell wall assembly